MRPRVYIDTSVIGGCFDEEFAEWSKRLFDEFRMGVKIAVVSDVTHRELVDAPRAIRDILEDLPEGSIEEIAPSAEIRELAEAYVVAGALGGANRADAEHIASASVHRVDIVASWNFRHIVNLGRIRAFNAVNLRRGYPLLEVRTPREVVNE
jgi:hypothetical protein